MEGFDAVYYAPITTTLKPLMGEVNKALVKWWNILGSK